MEKVIKEKNIEEKLLINFYLCKARYNNLIKHHREGVIDYQTYELAFNRIVKQTFFIVMELPI